MSNVGVRADDSVCDLGSTPDDIEQFAGASGLQHLGDGHYQYNWATPKSYANSCKTLVLDLGDGIEHTAGSASPTDPAAVPGPGGPGAGHGTAAPVGDGVRKAADALATAG